MGFHGLLRGHRERERARERERERERERARARERGKCVLMRDITMGGMWLVRIYFRF
jgi:hypothetical protein